MATAGIKSNDIEVMARSASAAITFALEKEKKDYKRRMGRGSKVSRMAGSPIGKSLPEDKVHDDKSPTYNRNALKKSTAEKSSANSIRSTNTIRHRNGGIHAASSPRTPPVPRVSPSPRASAAPKFIASPRPSTAAPTAHRSSPMGQSLTSESSNSEKSPPLKVAKKMKSPMRNGFGGFLNKMFKGKHAPTKKHDPVNDATADDILKDLNFQSPLTSPGNIDATDLKMVKNPKKALKKVARYMNKAKELLINVPLPETYNAETVKRFKKRGTDPRDLAANARKAYRYASEAHRINKLVKEYTLNRPVSPTPPTPQITTALSNPDASWEEVRECLLKDKPVTKTYTPPALDDCCSVTSDEKTVFSEKVEREDHQRRMTELKLFDSTEFGFLKETDDSTRTGAFYSREAHRIIRAFDEEMEEHKQDDMSTMSPATVFSGSTTFSGHSVNTTTSELHEREAYKQKMAELELFSASNIAGSVTHVLASMQSTLDRSLRTFTETMMPLPTTNEDDDSIFDSGDEGSTATPVVKVEKKNIRPVMPYDRINASKSTVPSDDNDLTSRSCSESTSTSYRSGWSRKSSYSECDVIIEGEDDDATSASGHDTVGDEESAYSMEASSTNDSHDDVSESGSEATGNSDYTGASSQTGHSSRTDFSDHTGTSGGTGFSRQTGQSSQTGYSVQTGQSSETEYSVQTGQSSETGYSVQTGQSSETGYSVQTDQSSETGYSAQTKQSVRSAWSGVADSPRKKDVPVDNMTKVIGWIQGL